MRGALQFPVFVLIRGMCHRMRYDIHYLEAATLINPQLKQMVHPHVEEYLKNILEEHPRFATNTLLSSCIAYFTRCNVLYTPRTCVVNYFKRVKEHNAECTEFATMAVLLCTDLRSTAMVESHFSVEGSIIHKGTHAIKHQTAASIMATKLSPVEFAARGPKGLR